MIVLNNNVNNLKVAVFGLIVLLCVMEYATARPNHHNPIPGSGSRSGLAKFEGCDKALEEVCQQCAKKTKSPIVYPLCCNQEDGAFKWCESYLRYGIHID